MPDKNEKSKETFPIVIIGAGIAGLCISFYLNKKTYLILLLKKVKLEILGLKKDGIIFI